MKTKLRPIKWYRIIEGNFWEDNHYIYRYAVKQPDGYWQPVNSRYHKQRSRFR